MRPISIKSSLAEKSAVGIFRFALAKQTRFVYLNTAFARILGYAHTRETRKLAFDSLFVNPKDLHKFYSEIDKHDFIAAFDVQLRTKTAAIAWVTMTAFLVKSIGRFYVQGFINDIGPRKKKEDELLLDNGYFQGLLDHIPDAIYFKDIHNKIIKVNKYYRDGVKRPLEEIIGKTDFDFFPKEQAEKMFADDQSVLSTGVPIVGRIERTLLPNGTWNQVITTKIPVSDRNGIIIGTMGITRDMTMYSHLEQERMSMLRNALTVVGRILELRDPYTFNHNHQVGDISEQIGKTLGWDENRLLGLRLAGELHDLGKISLPLDILNKPGKLNDLEYQLVQGHVKNCYDLMKNISFPFPLAEIIYQHHERMDGSGYPQRLKGDAIFTEARILAVSDVLQSMTCQRPYRESMGMEKAREELIRGSGIVYDPHIVETAVKLIEENEGKIFWGN